MERSDIVCNADSIEVFLPVQFFSVPSRVTWLDPNCSITSNSTHYVSTIKHGQCGTTVSLTKDNVIFENEIKASVLTTQNIFVNFGKPFVIPVKCIYPRKEMTLSSYQPLKQQVRVYEKRFGHLDIDMRQYETNQFRHALEESNYPRKHILNSDIFFKVTLQNNGAAELGIRLDTCIATKTSSPYDNVFIKLIENGCPKVNFVHLLPSPVNETRFSLSAFEFTSSQSNVVYIHCQASVCLAASQCTSDCTASGRTKRDLSSEPSHLLSMGPLMFVSDKVYASNLVANAIAGVSATIAMVAIVVAVMGWRRKTKGNVKDNQLY